MKITKKTTFGELLEKKPELAKKLAERGLFCGGCPMAMIETIEQGCCMHGIDVGELLDELNGVGEK